MLVDIDVVEIMIACARVLGRRIPRRIGQFCRCRRQLQKSTCFHLLRLQLVDLLILIFEFRLQLLNLREQMLIRLFQVVYFGCHFNFFVIDRLLNMLFLLVQFVYNVAIYQVFLFHVFHRCFVRLSH